MIGSRRAIRLRRLAAPLVGIAVVLAAAVMYIATLDNGLRPDELLGGDLITHHYAQVQARPSNAPGYPLYTMGGWLWFRLGRLVLGRAANPIPILSSYSVLWAVVSLGLLYALCLRVTLRARGQSQNYGTLFADGNWLIAGLCTAFYAVTYFFWYYSVTTEQYTSAVAQTLAIQLVPARPGRSGRCGVGPHGDCPHHRTTVAAIRALASPIHSQAATAAAFLRRSRTLASAQLHLRLPERR